MGEVFDLTRAVAFLFSSKSGSDDFENWVEAERVVCSCFGDCDSEAARVRVAAYLKEIPASVRRRCDPTGMGYVAERVVREYRPR